MNRLADMAKAGRLTIRAYHPRGGWRFVITLELPSGTTLQAEDTELEAAAEALRGSLRNEAFCPTTRRKRP